LSIPKVVNHDNPPSPLRLTGVPFLV
jgi:hypothetical protein